MKTKNLLLLTIATLVLSFTSYAQSKVAYINTQQLITEMPEVIAAQKQLEQIRKTYTEELDNSIKTFQEKAQAYSADAENQSEITNQARQRELESMQQNITEYRESVSQELQKKNVDLMKPLYEKAKAAIIKIATDQGYDYVLDSSDGGSVIMAKGKDLMSEVKQELGF